MAIIVEEGLRPDGTDLVVSEAIGCLTSGPARGVGFKDIAGQTFARLTAIRPLGRNRNGWLIWEARCECGRTKAIAGVQMRTGATRSCGCLLGDSKVVHGASRRGRHSREYRSWQHAIERCERATHHEFHRYGGRGISMCARWRESFQAFLADMGPRPPDTSLDRWPNPDGNYEPGNCRWATAIQQRHNRGKGAQ